MAQELSISTGEQSISATGPVTGTLATTTVTGDFTIRVRVRNLTAGAVIRIAIEDTANATPFSDAQTVWVTDIEGAPIDGVEREKRSYDLDSGIRIGAANTALRANVTFLTTNATAQVYAWLEV